MKNMKRKDEETKDQPSSKKLKEDGKKENDFDYEEFMSSQDEIQQSQGLVSSQESSLKTSETLKSKFISKEQDPFEKNLSKEEEELKKRQENIFSINKDLYQHFNELQVLSQQYNLNFQTPELVVVGMQSDGKSSFVEALLGFQFNTIETQIGTRRPLILQMVNDTNFETPLCTFYKEGMKGLESEPTPVDKIESEIKKRTNDVCGTSNVSSLPIILNVRYKYCTTLTIYDTPGFRKGEDDPLGEKIQKMVLKILQQKHRMIICLEQSTVEWCNTQVRPLISIVDPKFERTIFITTKFNNRLNQFKDREECNGYLDSNGLPFFFLSLPSGPNARNLSAEKFKQKIREVYLSDLSSLLRLNYDQKYKERLGFFAIKNHLEKLLNEKLKQHLKTVIVKLKETVSESKKEKEGLEREIQVYSRDDIEEISSKLINEYIKHIHSALRGTTLFNALQNGFTLDEEKELSGFKTWPNYKDGFSIRNSQYKLYGGSQIERLLSEFEIVANSQEFPQTSNDEVAVTIGLGSLHTRPDYDAGASDLAQKKCNFIFTPLIDVLLNRSKFIMSSIFKIVTEFLKNDQKNQKYSLFLDELKKSSERFIETLITEVRLKAFEEFETFTKIIDWDLISTSQKLDYDLLNPKKEDTEKRVREIIGESNENIQSFTEKSRDLTDERCMKIKLVAAKLFAGVRLLFVKYIRAKYNVFFLNPIFTRQDLFIRNHIKSIPSSIIKEMMGNQIDRLKNEKIILDEKILKLEEKIKSFEKIQ